ncbi:MAG: hypothetical protein IT444_00180 [Phycisphaeraceae bacterium]|nr:hypothetical protein [Phycisphaeraceae bacterium]
MTTLKTARRTIAVTALLAAALIALLGLPAGADEFDTPATTQPDKPVRRPDLFRKYSQIIGRHYALYEGDYVCVPSYDSRYPSSRGLTVNEAESQLTRTVERTNGMVVQSTTIKPDRAEVEAFALPLPRMGVGEYGWIRGGTVEQVLGPADMIVKNIVLIDRDALTSSKERARKQSDDSVDSRDRTSSYAEAERYRDEILNGDSLSSRTTRSTSSYANSDDLDRRFRQRDALVTLQSQSAFGVRVRVRGYATSRVVEGGEWIAGDKRQGAQIAIIRTVPDPKTTAASQSRNTTVKRIFEAIPLSELKLGLTEDQFAQLIESRGYDEKSFLEMAQAELRKSVKDGPGRIVETLEARRKDADDAPKPDATSQPSVDREPNKAEDAGDVQAPTTQPAIDDAAQKSDKPRRWQDATGGGKKKETPADSDKPADDSTPKPKEKPKRWQDM